MTRLSYQEQLAGVMPVIDEPLPCDGCGKNTPKWALYEGLEGEPSGWICGGCIGTVARQKQAQENEAAKLPANDWNSDFGIFLKAERNRLLETARWAVMPDSPLSEPSRAEFMAYLAVLNRMTVDCADPTTWVWPEAPTPAFD